MRRSFTIALRVLALCGLCLTCANVGTRAAALPLPTLGQNEAPILDVSKSPVLLDTYAGLGPPANGSLVGTPIALLVDAANPADGVDNVLDTDAAENETAWAQLGIALTAVSTGGTWYFTTNNCATWSVVPAVSSASSLLLAADANTRLYFNATTGPGDLTIEFRAWDRSSGTNGSIVSTTTNGGTTAFSISTDIATCYAFGVRQVVSTNSPASATLLVPPLSLKQVGDVMLLVIATSTAQTITTSHFTTLVDQLQSSTTTSRLWAGWRVVTASEPTYTVTLGGSTAYVATSMALPGINSIAPGPVQVALSQATPASLSHTAPAILPSAFPALIMSLHEFANSVTWTPPAGSIEDVDRASSGSNIAGVSLEVNHLFRTAGGTVGPYTALAASTFAADAGAAATVAWLLRNSAPMLDNSRSPVLNNVAANAPPPIGPVGTLVSALIDPASTVGGLDNLHDVGASSYGIAITAAYVANGSWYYSLNNGTSWNPMGIPSNTLSRLLAADAGTRVYFQPSPGFSNALPSALTFRAWDMTAGTNGSTANASVNGGSTAFSAAKDVASMGFIANVAPVNSVPGPAITEEDTPIMFSSIDGTMFTVSDQDAGPADVEVSLSVTSGTGILLMGSTNGITFTGGGDGSAAMTFTGPIAYLNAGLDGLLFIPAQDFTGPTSLTITTNDLGHTGGGGPLSDEDVVTITVAAVNDPPINLGPVQQIMPMNTPLILSQANGNALSIIDVDAGAGELMVTLAAPYGTLTISGMNGLVFTVGDGSVDAIMTFIGTLADINSAIDTVTFLPATDFGGPTNFTITIDDQGNSGAGGPWSVMGQVDISVTTPFVAVAPRVVLDGPYNSGTGLMADALRAGGLLPFLEPYSAMGYAHAGDGGGETTTAAVLAVTGSDAIVDWVVVELRSLFDPATVLATRSALLQRDGDVVNADGSSTVRFPLSAGMFYVAVRHRNHLGAMTDGNVALNTIPTVVDFTSATTATFGVAARKSITGSFPVQALWAGDVSFNKEVKYTGSGNDRDPILTTVGSTTPNNSVTAYSTRDVNMNGQVKYAGSGNDRDPILVNVGSTTPNGARIEQLP